MHHFDKMTVAALALAIPAALAHARPEYCEMGDAGQGTGSSQSTNGQGPLTRINGNLEGTFFDGGDFTDMYLINVTDPAIFQARVVTADPASQVRPQLWLFRGPIGPGPLEGQGLLGHNGEGLPYDGALLLSESNDGSGAGLTEPGLYHLAISGQSVVKSSAPMRRVSMEEISDGPCGTPLVAPVTIAGDTCLEQDSCALRPGVDAQFEITIPADGLWSFAVCGAPWDTVLFLGVGCCDTIAQDDDGCPGLSSRIELFLTAGVYTLTLEGAGPGACGPFELVVESSGPGGAVGRVPQSDNPVPPPPGLDIFEFLPGFEISGPDGPGGAQPITQWRNVGDTGKYTIDLRGVTLTTSTCPQDIDHSGSADFPDVLEVLANWGDCPTCPFDEDFDSYPTGTLVPQGGWEAWDMDPGAALAVVTTAEARSAPNSLRIEGPDDIVHRYDGYTSGTWILTAHQFVPSVFSGETAFILLNTYTSSADANWSLQLAMDSATNVVRDLNGPATLPLVRNRWVEIRVVIDLDADTQTVYYDDEVFVVKSWTEGGTGGGALNIGAVDLFGNGSTDVYYDDVTLCPVGGAPCPTDLDGNGATEFADLLPILGGWGPCP